MRSLSTSPKNNNAVCAAPQWCGVYVSDCPFNRPQSHYHTIRRPAEEFASQKTFALHSFPLYIRFPKTRTGAVRHHSNKQDNVVKTNDSYFGWGCVRLFHIPKMVCMTYMYMCIGEQTVAVDIVLKHMMPFFASVRNVTSPPTNHPHPETSSQTSRRKSASKESQQAPAHIIAHPFTSISTPIHVLI